MMFAFWRRAVAAAGLLVAALAWAQTPPAGAPVVVEGRTLFTVQTNLGPFSAQARAAAASERINQLAHDLTASLDGLAAVAGDTSTDIVLGDQVLMTVTEADARSIGSTRTDLAASYLLSIRLAVNTIRADYSSRSLLLGAVYTVLITIALVLLLYGLGRLRRAAIMRVRSAKFRPIRVQRVELLSPRRIQGLLVQLVKMGRLVLALAALYLYVPTVLAQFPWTRQYAPRIVDYVVMPLRSAGQAVVDYLPSLFVLIITSVGAYLLTGVSRFLFQQLSAGTITWSGFHPEWAMPTHKIVRFLILALALVVAFPYLPGSGSPAFQGISLFLGVLISLGSSSAIANIVSGVILTYTRAFQLGDRVKIADTTGDVMEKTLLVTRIRTIKNEFITVPNSMVLGSHIVNFSANDSGLGLILHSTVTIGYDVPWRQVHELLIEAAGRTEHLAKEPAPFVLQTSLDDFFVSYQINAFTDAPARMAVTYGELHQNIQDCFNEAGVEIMSPHFTSLRDGGDPAMPPKYRGKPGS